MKVSKTGLAFAGFYLIITLVCVAGALSADGDDKGHFVLLQLPLTIALAPLVHYPSLRTFVPDTWPATYLLFWTPTAFLFFLAGWLIEALFKYLWKACRAARK